MNKVILLICLLGATHSQAQSFELISGPMYGHFTDSTQKFWLMVKPIDSQIPYQDWMTTFNQSIFQYFEDSTAYTIKEIGESEQINEEYIIIKGTLNKKKPKKLGRDISFMVGSCSMPMPFPLLFLGKKRQDIFDVMTPHDKDFMLWLGDNVYYLFGQWNTKKKMHKQNIRARTNPKIRNFLESCPQYAIWDDHDFGPNNSGAFYDGKYNSLDIFKKYWLNPYYGLDTVPGVFNHFSHADADFFMLDGRFYAVGEKTMLGDGQTQWLKEKLKASTANFKFIVSGAQILSTGIGEDMGDYGDTRQDLYDFLKKENITGVIIISGDRHYAELLKRERAGTYPLYEMTTSPLTSIINPAYTKGLKERQEGTLTLEPNFAKVHLFGNEANRKCRLELFDAKGKKLWDKDILLSELK